MDRPKRGCVEAGLPNDALVEILARVPAKSLCRFKCVSRVWRDLINDPHHRKKLPQAMEGLFFLAEPQVSDAHFEVQNLGFIDLTARSVPLDIDPCFSVLTGLPEIQSLVLVSSCNGFLLFENRPKSGSHNVLGYIVFNPTTKHWGTVPTCGCPVELVWQRYTYLAFDPAISSHFHLVLWNEHHESEKEDEDADENITMSACAYSSETGTWIHSQTDWDEQAKQGLKGWRHTDDCTLRMHAFVENRLHLFVWIDDLNEHQILVADVQGKTQMMISLPLPAYRCLSQRHTIAHSQGLLHYICEHFRPDSGKLFRPSVWVIQDYDAKKWVRKDVMFENVDCSGHLADMHQDSNVLFVVERYTYKLIAYDLDRKEESVIYTSGNKRVYEIVARYVPYFADSPALANRA